MHRTITLMAVLALLSGVAAAQGPGIDIDITKIKTEPVPLQTSEYADIWLRVVNNGTGTGDDISVRFSPSFPFSVDPDEKTSWDIGRMFVGNEYHIRLQVKVDENAVHGTNQLSFQWSSTSRGWIEEKVPVEIRTDDAALVIDRVEFPDKVGPGAVNPMGFHLRNLADSQLKNIDVSLDLSDLPFATSGTTRKRVQKLGSGESETVIFSLQVDEGAENGVYRVPVNLEYENEAGTNFSRTETTGVVVGGDSELSVGIEERDLVSAGVAGGVTLRLVNRGQGQARFVSMEVPDGEGYEVVSPRTVYIGNMDPDDYQTASFRVYAESAADNLTLPVRLSYKDASGTPREEVLNVNLELYTREEVNRFNLSSGGNALLYLFIVIILAGAGAFYWWRKKRR